MTSKKNKAIYCHELRTIQCSCGNYMYLDPGEEHHPCSSCLAKYIYGAHLLNSEENYNKVIERLKREKNV